MLEGKFTGFLEESSTDINIDKILELAEQSHENYLIQSTEKDLDKAVSYYMEAINIDPSIPEAYYKLASLLWEKGRIDLDFALNQCKKAVDLDKNNPIARLYLGYFLRAAKKFPEAEAEFRAAIKSNRILSGKPRLALAKTIFQKLKSSRLDFAELSKIVYYFCSGILLKSLDFNSHRLLYKSLLRDVTLSNNNLQGYLYRITGNYNKAIDIYKNAAEKTGKTDLFYSKIGDILVETGNYTKASEYYKESLKTCPNSIILWSKLASILRIINKNEIPEIIECYDNLARLDPSNSGIHYELGHLHLKLNDKFKALKYINRAIELESDNAFYHNSLAYILVQLEDYDGAIFEYQKAIRLNPNNEWTSIVLQALGAVYQQVKNNTEAAILAYQTAVVLDPCNVDAFIALGEVYQARKDLTNAIDSYCQAMKLDPSIIKLYCNLGLALWDKEYIDEAIIVYQKALQLDPDYDVVLNNLGVVYLDGAHKPEDALDMFDKAIKSNPNYAIAYYNKGRAYQSLGNKTDAAEYYQMALDINKFTQEFDESEVNQKIYNLFAC